jgi:acyl-CoA synthetase (AMP-forming)/AMP-acid ligase II
LSESDLIAHVKTRIADYKAPRRVVLVDQVYRSPSGKADYRWARERAQS